MTATDQSVGRGKAMPCPYRMYRIFNSNWYHTTILFDHQMGWVQTINGQ
ncbi:MAG: hypothetical protein KME45_15220 [Stenomitos rutilans HA7619-LM2]|nr:hypothetical protein [Stenomitos rutilans HA7619-LM2]